MAHGRINRKGFLKSLGLVAAACVVRPAGAAVVQADSAKKATAGLELLRKTKAASRTVAFRGPSL